MKAETKHMDGKVEFDILVDGKYQKRVSKGLLFEDTHGGGCLAISCHKVAVFKAIHGLKGFLKDNDLVEEYEEFERFMSLDTRGAIDEILKKLDEMLE